MVSKINKKLSIFIYMIFACSFIGFFNPSNAQAIGNLEKNYLKDYTVKAYTSPSFVKVSTMGNDLIAIQIKQGSSQIRGIYAENINNSADNITVNVANGSATTYYLSLKNGIYKIALLDSSGKYTLFTSAVQITASCDNQSALNATGSGSVNRCFKYNGSTIKPDVSGDIVKCASGYVLDMDESGLYRDNCAKLNTGSLTSYALTYRYCTRSYSYKCVKENAATTSYLKSLSLSSGTLSPSFNAKTTSYTATVNASSVSINASLNSDGSSFVSGSGPRTVSLKYGTNTFSIKVKSSSGNVTTYTIKITRPDNRSSVNTLKSLSIDGIKFNESFSATRTSYTASVANDVTKAYVNAELTNSKSSFVQGYGPRSITLKEGLNTIQIKVKSEKGTTKTYTIKITRASSSNPKPENPPINTDNLGLLKSITLSSGNIEFDPKVQEYNLTVPYEVTTLLIDPVPQNSEDVVTITGHENLVVEETNVVTIKVQTKEDFIRIYTINVIRKGEDLEVSNDSSLKELTIEGHEIEFTSDNYEYEVVLNKKETTLEIKAVTNDENASVEILNNEKLQKGSEITIKVTAEDASTTEYVIVVTGVEKGPNIFLIIIIVLILVLVIAYTILRILGYKIYFNFSMLGSMFRNFGKKDKDE